MIDGRPSTCRWCRVLGAAMATLAAAVAARGVLGVSMRRAVPVGSSAAAPLASLACGPLGGGLSSGRGLWLDGAAGAAVPARGVALEGCRWASTSAEDGVGSGEDGGEGGVAGVAGAGGGLAGEPDAPRRKYKSHFKRASSVMADLHEDHTRRMFSRMEKLRRGAIPHFEVGDAIELKYAAEVGDDYPLTVRGIVIRKRSNAMDSSFTILNKFDDTVITLTYPYATPLLKDVKLLSKWRLHDGKRRTRKSKLYYLRDRPTKEFQV